MTTHAQELAMRVCETTTTHPPIPPTTCVRGRGKFEGKCSMTSSRRQSVLEACFEFG